MRSYPTLPGITQSWRLPSCRWGSNSTDFHMCTPECTCTHTHTPTPTEVLNQFPVLLTHRFLTPVAPCCYSLSLVLTGAWTSRLWKPKIMFLNCPHFESVPTAHSCMIYRQVFKVPEPQILPHLSRENNGFLCMEVKIQCLGFPKCWPNIGPWNNVALRALVRTQSDSGGAWLTAWALIISHNQEVSTSTALPESGEVDFCHGVCSAQCRVVRALSSPLTVNSVPLMQDLVLPQDPEHVGSIQWLHYLRRRLPAPSPLPPSCQQTNSLLTTNMLLVYEYMLQSAWLNQINISLSL